MENTDRIPFPEENPTGLHAKYHIQKYKGKRISGYSGDGRIFYEPILEPVEPDAEYFVLRLDKNGSDPLHISACRKAILIYAEEIKGHLPELAKDLIERYSK